MAQPNKAVEMTEVDGVRFRPEHVEAAKTAKALRDAGKPAPAVGAITGKATAARAAADK